MTEHWGGLPSDWELFRTLGHSEDLLPVVSNPHADISPKSTMKDKGKTPSQYNKAGLVVGIPQWTAIKANNTQLDKWETISDYGICIQTRFVRAIDIDVSDQAKATAIVAFIDAQLGFELPLRFRSNSGKCLLAFTMAGTFGKRRMTVDGGVIELLANGQQFVAAGHHPSGVLYEWNWRGNNHFPALTMEQVGALWGV